MASVSKALVLIIALAFSSNAKGQCLTINFIKNPGLEDYSCCPTRMERITCADYWAQPLTYLSTSDYFNTCGIDSLEQPDILPFFLHNYFGDGYAGIQFDTYSPSLPPYREYIQGTLSEELLAGQCYFCSFWVKLFNLENQTPFAAIDAISIFFSDTLPKKTAADELAFYLPAQVNNPTGRIITDTLNWTQISDTFIAKGGEKYFTVGTFIPENEINKIYFFTPHYDDSYYFLDNFSLCPCSDTIPPPEPPNAVYIPNIFSPNGDGNNDVLYVRGQNISALDFKVYNRWGNLVFHSTDTYEGWNGKQSGRECDNGVYFYVAEVTFANGEVVRKSGNVTMVR